MKENFSIHEKNFLVETSQKQNFSFGDSITINHDTIRKTFLFLKNIEKQNTWRICPDFAVDLF